MAERSFDGELESWFAEAPALADGDLFAQRVAYRLERGWAFRGFLIGGLGIVGGLIGAAQVLNSGVLGRLGEAEARSGAVTRGILDRFFDTPIGHWTQANGVAMLLNGASGVDTEALWMSLGLAALAAGLLVTRAIRAL